MGKINVVDFPESFDGYCFTKVTTMGNITEVLTMQKPARGCPCRKVDKDHYVDVRTGEVNEYRHLNSRSDSLESIRQTLCKVRALVNANITDVSKVRWGTLTYAENMTDAKRLYKDFASFWKRFCYWCSKQGFSKPEYIIVVEPQGRGAWHLHTFFIWSDVAPFVPNDALASLWGHGFTKIKALQNCDNVGAYFSAYLGDMPLDDVLSLPADEQIRAFSVSGGSVENKEFVDDQGFIKKKKFVKGGRLHLYPPGMNIIRSTKGIKQPLVEYMSREEAEKKVSAATETFSRAYEVLDDSGEVVNTICKSYYNSVRKK